MSESKHTPGPWRVGGRYVEGGKPPAITVVREDGIEMVDVGWCRAAGLSRRQALANARLIAAAPYLLAVAEMAERGPEDRLGMDLAAWIDALRARARAAIAKARGAE